MTPVAFINPAVIHRSAALLAAERGERGEPLRYREGIAIPGGNASLPLRYLAAGALAGMQAGFRGLTRSGPAVRGARPRSCAGSCRPRASVPPARSSTSGPGTSPPTPAPPAATTCGSTSTPTATPAT
jgi:hypothetical protein